MRKEREKRERIGETTFSSQALISKKSFIDDDDDDNGKKSIVRSIVSKKKSIFQTLIQAPVRFLPSLPLSLDFRRLLL